MSHSRFLVLVIAMIVSLPSSLLAQTSPNTAIAAAVQCDPDSLAAPARDNTPAVFPTAAASPFLAAQPVGVRPKVEAALDSEAAAAAATRRLTKGASLMIVGGAALVVGLIIEDDVGTLFAVTGAAIGLYGLYLYLERQ